MSCRQCGTAGHNRATCPARSDADKADDRATRKRRPPTAVINALIASNGSVTKAAAMLGVTPQAVDQQAKKHGLKAMAKGLKSLTKPTPWETREAYRRVAAAAGKRRYAATRAAGLCPCKRAVVPGRSKCRACLKNAVAANKKAADGRRLLGQCPHCGGKPKPGRKYCAARLKAIGEAMKRLAARRKP